MRTNNVLLMLARCFPQLYCFFCGGGTDVMVGKYRNTESTSSSSTSTSTLPPPPCSLPLSTPPPSSLFSAPPPTSPPPPAPPSTPSPRAPDGPPPPRASLLPPTRSSSSRRWVQRGCEGSVAGTVRVSHSAFGT